MERSLGHDFSGVRVHSDGQAARSAQDITAAAYTVGSHVVFGAGRYAPQTRAGQRLLAHELAHVVQRRAGADDAPLLLGQGGSALEREADQAALRISAGRAGTVSLGLAPAGLVQRSPLSDAVRDSVGSQPTLEAVLTRLGASDVQAAQSDADLDAEIGRLLGGRADDIWLAQRVWDGLRAATTGGKGPRPIEAFFFAGATNRRALVIAGVHGSERQGIEVAHMLIDLLRKQQPQLTTIVVPTLFPDNAAKGTFGTREESTPTNRNFPKPSQDLAAARAAGSVDAKGRTILPENLLLLELMEKFQPERIISIHGTWKPSAAGVFYDPRALRADEETQAASARPGGRVNYTSEGEEKAATELRNVRRRQMLKDADETDKRLSLAAATQIDRATSSIKGREGRVGPKRLKAHPSVAGNVGASGDLDRPFWGGDTPEGVSLGSYAPPRGISVFTVEPPIDRNVEDYQKRADQVADKVSAADRKTELMAYADAVLTILLGPS